MKIATTGYKGKIGQRLVALNAIPLECDIKNAEEVRRAIMAVSPDVIIHAAAKSDVDYCEKNFNDAFDTNAYGANNVLQIAQEVGAKAILLSSEQVFNGFWGTYSEKAKPKPVNVYGQTKALAEALASVWDAKILRLSRGLALDDGDIKRAFEYIDKDEAGFTVPSFYFRNYQHVDFLAEQIWWCANHFDELPEILHLGGREYASNHAIISKLAKAYGYKGVVQKRRHENNGFAPRPKNCGFNLKLARKIGVPMRLMEETIERLIYEHNRNSRVQE